MDYWSIIPPIKLKGTHYTLTGYSRAARKTSFYIPELKILLDCGISTNFSPEHIFITHGHLDHCFNLPMTLCDNPVKPIIYVPNEIEEYIKNFIHHAYVLCTLDHNPEIHKFYTLKSVFLENFIIKIKNTEFIVEIFKCFHTIPCLGYGFIEIRKKLKDEYKEIMNDKKKLIELKKSGVELMHQIKFPIFCYIGDTSDEILVNKELEKYPIIMIECTFLYPEHEEYAKINKHIHWNHINKYICDHEKITFILYHFSNRYNELEIVEFFKKNTLCTNIIPWC